MNTRTESASRFSTSNFGTGPPFTLGVEEELLIVNADNELAELDPSVIRRADPAAGEVGEELFTAMVECRTAVMTTAAEALAALDESRQELLRAGARIMGAGLHPTARPGESGVADARRYKLMRDSLKGVLRTPICGQHIHVGMPDEETATRVYNGIRAHVPLLNALASNSPFWFGEDSGLASSRTVVFRSYPRMAMAPEFVDFEHFARVTHEVCVAAGVDDYTQIWWDARIHPVLGTVEIRAADTQFDLRRSAALAALVHCLARVEAERPPGPLPCREALAESSFQATRHGLDAQLINRRSEAMPARELGKATLELAATVAPELGCEHELAQVEVMLDAGSGADLQRRVHAAEGMDGLLAYLVEETQRPRIVQ
jgi:carboxylate-amine ligase